MFNHYAIYMFYKVFDSERSSSPTDALPPPPG